MAGRPAKPTALKKLEGHLNKKMLNKKEPMPLVKDQTCPAFLDDIGKVEWKRIVPELDRLGLITIVDRIALAGYCDAYSKWRKAIKYIQENGLVFEYTRVDKDGKDVGKYRQPNPEVVMAHQSAQLILKYCQEFGLTPSARVRLSAGKAQLDDSEMEDLLD